ASLGSSVAGGASAAAGEDSGFGALVVCASALRASPAGAGAAGADAAGAGVAEAGAAGVAAAGRATAPLSAGAGRASLFGVAAAGAVARIPSSSLCAQEVPGTTLSQASAAPSKTRKPTAPLRTARPSKNPRWLTGAA